MSRLAIVLLLLVTTASQVYAGTYTDRLSECVIAKATPEDMRTMNRWVFIAMSKSHDVQGLITIPDAEANAVSQQVNDLFTDLLIHRCTAEARLALLHEGHGGIGDGFAKLGNVAITNLINDPHFYDYAHAPLSPDNLQQLQDTFKDITPAGP